MSIAPNNSASTDIVYNVNQLKEIIKTGSITVNGQTKYFQELLKEDSFIQNPDLYNAAFNSIVLDHTEPSTTILNYERAVRSYILLSNPHMRSSENTKKVYQNTLIECEKNFSKNLEKFFSFRNDLMGKPATEMEKKISNEASKIHQRLNELDSINGVKGDASSGKAWSALTQNMMRNNEENIEKGWHEIVGKMTDLLHFDSSDPKNLQSVENSLLKGEYDDVYLLNALINGEAIIDGKKESFQQLLADPKFIQHPQLYTSALQVIDKLKNHGWLSRDEMGQLLRAYDVLQSSNVTSLPERRFYQVFANQTYNNAVAACENQFLNNFNEVLDIRYSPNENSQEGRQLEWPLKLMGNQTVLKNLNSLPNNTHVADWNAVKTALIQGKSQEAEKIWKGLLATAKASSMNFLQDFEVENYLLRGIIPFSAHIADTEDDIDFNEVRREEDAMEGVPSREEAENAQNDEIPPRVKQIFRDAILSGKLPTRANDLLDENFADFLELSIKYNIPHLEDQCISQAKNFCHSLSQNYGERILPDISNMRVLQKLYSIDNQRLRDVIKKETAELGKKDDIRSNLKDYLARLIDNPAEIKEYIKICKDLNLNYLLESCEEAFKKVRFPQIHIKGPWGNPRNPEDIPPPEPLVRAQNDALFTKPEDIGVVIEQALDLGFTESATEAYTKLIDHTSILFVKSSYENLEKEIVNNSKLQQRYLDVVKKYALTMSELEPKEQRYGPKEERYKIIALLFNNELFSTEIGEELFKHIFSIHFATYHFIGVNSNIKKSIMYSKKKGKLHSFKIDGINPHSRLTLQNSNISIDKLLDLYQKSLNVADKLNFNWLKIFLPSEIFSIKLISKLVLDELPKLEKEEKFSFISSTFSRLSTLISFSNNELDENTANEIVSLGNVTFMHMDNELKTNNTLLKFNDPTTSDISFVVKNASNEKITLHLHKDILKHSPYFESIFRSGFKEANSSEIQIQEDDLAAFTEIIKFVYTGKLEITEENVFGIPHLAKKYQIEPYLLLASQVYLWFSLYLKELTKEKNNAGANDNSLDFATCKALIELFEDPTNEYLLNNKEFSEDIYTYIFNSLENHMQAESEMKENTLTFEEVKEGLLLLQQHKSIYSFNVKLLKFAMNFSSSIKKYDLGKEWNDRVFIPLV